MHHKVEFLPLADVPHNLEGDVILGGGVCGCLLAHELLTRTQRPVWVIEAGGQQEENSMDRSRPARWLHLLGSSDDDSHVTLPNEGLAGRALNWPRGRGPGGSGRINAMIWMPPHERDYQCLSQAGLDPDSVRRAWQRARELVAVEYPRYLSSPSRDFLAAMDAHPELGVFAAHHRINRDGRRWTTDQLLSDAMHADPSTVSRLRCVRATAMSLQIQGDRPSSLTLRGSQGERVVAIDGATRVISCLGALATPGLLMRSGIGDPEVLGRAGLTTRVARNAVGRNLHDHLIMPVVYDREPPAFLPGSPTVHEAEQWEQHGAGPLASNIAECGGFSRDASFQLHVTPTDYLRYPQSTANAAVTLGVNLTRPASRGWLEPIGHGGDVRLNIHSNYMSDPADVSGFPTAIRWVREIAAALNCTGVLGLERVPGLRRSDEARLLASIARYAQTLYHPGGTCAIGRDQDTSVVDPDFGVRGVTGLSVVDASLFPEPTTGNPTAVLAILACYAAERLSTANIASRMRYCLSGSNIGCDDESVI